MINKTIECPAADCTCPYYSYGICTIYPEANPILECDEFAYYDGDECDYEVGYDPYLGCYTEDC